MSRRTGLGHVAKILYSAQMSLISSYVIDTVLATRDIVANKKKAKQSEVSRKGMMNPEVPDTHRAADAGPNSVAPGEEGSYGFINEGKDV